MAIEVAGQHPINVFTNPMSYGKTNAEGQFESENGSAIETKGSQLVPYAYLANAINDIKDYSRFQQLATTREQPLHSGKTMKMNRYFGVIDDKNINDQGIDANGKVSVDGNLWGSSRDPGVIKAKMPWGREGGGRINRIGFSRGEISTTLKKIQFFWEYTEDDIMFDSDKEYFKHITARSVEASNKIVENLIQLDLINSAEIKLFGGGVDADANADGVVDDGEIITSISSLGAANTISYTLFSTLYQAANRNDVPTNLMMIKGSSYTDTRVIPNSRMLFVPDELMPDIERIKDFHDKQAFVSAEHYAAAGNLLNGEEGKVGKFRIVSVQDMQYAGVGAGGATAEFHKDADDKHIVFPMIMVGADSFNAVTLHSSKMGSKFKWRVISKKPGAGVADRHDPYGENGFSSSRLYYGFLALRPERIAVCYVTARI